MDEILELLRSIDDRLIRIEGEIYGNSPQSEEDIINKHEAARLISCHVDTLKTYRQSWIEGIHYFKGKRGKITYSRTMLKDWLINGNDPIAHTHAIELFNQQKFSNQKPKRLR